MVASLVNAMASVGIRRADQYPVPWVGAGGSQQRSRQELYQDLESYYYNSIFAEQTGALLRSLASWADGATVQGIFNPIKTIVDFYRLHTLQGTLGEEGQEGVDAWIQAENRAIIGPVLDVLRWSNFETRRGLIGRLAANLGDCLLVVIDDARPDAPEQAKVYVEIRHPGELTDYEFDTRGNLTLARLTETRHERNAAGQRVAYRYERILTKTEYANTLRDLFGVDPSVADGLPDEVSGEGYLNSLSPLQLEQYLAIADKVLRQMPAAAQKRLLAGPARQVAASLARKAYRRPPTDAEVNVLMAAYDLGQRNKLTQPQALQLMVKAVLVSPQFLFITPAGEAQSATGIVPLDDYQLASRLSYLLWATMPDDQLMALADAGKLHEPAVLKAQTKRLLEDRRSRALFDGFGAHWLGVGGLKRQVFDPALFPQMTPAMRQSMYDEVRLFFESIVREDQSVIRFVDANYSYVNETLAPLYGLEKSVKGPALRRVQLADGNRGGVLGMPGILAATSFPNRTSAVKRGIWVLEQVLGEHVPPAPPDVPALDKQDPALIAKMTVRQRTELHRTNAVCANCHQILDPIGFGLEKFDAIGRWRDQDTNGQPIDSTGELPGGHRFAGPRDLKTILGGRTAAVSRNLLERLLAYSLGRKLEGYDEIVVDDLMEALAKDGYRMRSLIDGVVTSYPFTNRRVADKGAMK